MQIQLNPPEALTLEFRPTGGRRSLTLGRAWNELLGERLLHLNELFHGAFRCPLIMLKIICYYKVSDYSVIRFFVAYTNDGAVVT